MSDLAIRVENLGKRYQIGGPQAPYKTLRETLTDLVGSPLRRVRALAGGQPARGGQEALWALRDISFEVRRGQVIGIIGSNGAGKSTLLKILARITEPTEGQAELRGRVGTLLEVGTGFHPELTGRENIYLNGAILGMKRSESDRKFDEIVAFAEVERFIDTPVKHYSSGMYLRLAFAVAAHLEPEILIVDEVLAVGDAQFQKKCLGKMEDVAHQGRTVLFVSHNMTAMRSLCDDVIWLDKGKIVEEGPTPRVIANYLQTASTAPSERVWHDIASAPGNERVRLRAARVRPEEGMQNGAITLQTPLDIEIEYWNLVPDTYLNLSLVLWNEEQVPVFNTFPMKEPNWHGRPFPAGLFRSSCAIPANLLNDGRYRVDLYVVKDQNVLLYRHDDLLKFEVHDDMADRGAWYGKWLGAVRPDLAWRTELIELS
jgi:lipopolysaccharide transport system ATP-binding protein